MSLPIGVVSVNRLTAMLVFVSFVLASLATAGDRDLEAPITADFRYTVFRKELVAKWPLTNTEVAGLKVVARGPLSNAIQIPHDCCMSISCVDVEHRNDDHHQEVRVVDTAPLKKMGADQLYELAVFSSDWCLDDVGIRSLRRFSELRSLWLHMSHSVNDFSVLSGFKKLQCLHVFGRGTDDGTVKVGHGNFIKIVSGMKDLRGLWLMGFDIDDHALGELSTLERLEVLDINHNPGGDVSDAGIKDISRLSKLRVLNLYLGRGGRVTDSGILAIAACRQLERVTFMAADNVTRTGVGALRDSLPNVQIVVSDSEGRTVTTARRHP